MCKGLFLDGTPYVFANILFPAHYKKKKEFPPLLTFLMDTGADTTMINSIDAEKLGIKYKVSVDGVEIPFFGGQPLEEAKKAIGVGGEIRTYIVRSVMLILKTSLNGHVEYHTEYLDAIGIPEGGAVEIPSLLGRDIINRFSISYNMHEELIDLSRISIPGSGYSVHLD